MQIDQHTTLIDPVTYCPSPHCDERPDKHDISLIVIHGISLPPGEFGSQKIPDFFCGKLNFDEHPALQSISHLRVSAHLLIDRKGHLIQFVPFEKRAWHAGVSQYEGREACNNFSIGIELEGTDHVPYEIPQYEMLAKVIRLLMDYYPKITQTRITSHAHIAPGRKTDPGPFFDWDHLHSLLL